MRFLSGFWAFLKGATTQVLGHPFNAVHLTAPKGRNGMDRPVMVTIPPRKEWDGTDERDDPPVCSHEPHRGYARVNVHGHEVDVRPPDGSGICLTCFQKWLDRHATTCAVCGEPILPGSSVAERSPFDDPPFVHMRPMCCRYPSKYCGKWGAGRLISLHEMHPDHIPPGTRTLADHAMRKNPGQPWFEGWNPRIKPN